MTDSQLPLYFSPVLAAADLHSPVLWAVVVAWTFTVVLHELAHGVVAHFGGDYTIKARGLLTLNPLKYIDPMFSIVMPLFFLLQGGVPLAGGVTYVREDLLFSRLWATAVSLAGPAMNFILFLLLILPFHPAIGWVQPSYLSIEQWMFAQLFLVTLASTTGRLRCFGRRTTKRCLTSNIRLPLPLPIPGIKWLHKESIWLTVGEFR